MRFLSIFSFAGIASATILQNGQIREEVYPDTRINPADYKFATYRAGTPEVSYKGRWDAQHISWWSAPGLKFGFSGKQVAITMGPNTINTTLVAYRLSGLDWQFTNVTAGATHLFISENTPGVDLESPITPKTFELRVTNWEYGIQIDKIHVATRNKLIKLQDYNRRIEFIGDSITQGYGATYEGLSSFAWALADGLGDTEFSINGFSGICLQDKLCWGHERGLSYQWFRTSDVSGRASTLYGSRGEKAPRWDFTKQQAADIVVINAGTNDENSYNIPDPAGYVAHYKTLVQGVHAIWPKAQVILVIPVGGFGQNGNTYTPSPIWPTQIKSVADYFNSPEYLAQPVLYDHIKNKTYYASAPSQPFVHLFDTKGMLTHNDYQPKYHPTDFGHIKLATHLMQYIKIKFGWELLNRGEMVLSGTTYWNDQDAY